MIRTPVTHGIGRRLTENARAAGITALDVAAVITRRDQVLLIEHDTGPDFHRIWTLPTAAVPPGTSLLDTLAQLTAGLTGDIRQITGYLGHHDHPADPEHAPGDQETVRTFGFAVIVHDPAAICRSPHPCAHLWAFLDEQLPGCLTDTTRNLLDPSARTSRTVNAGAEHPLAAPLRACAQGIYPDEAGIELLIGHDNFLHRDEFTSHIQTGTSSTPHAAVDWAAVIDLADSGKLPWSGGEQRMIRLMASLAAGIPVNLRHALTGLDDRNTALVIKSMWHAAGHRPSAWRE
jgi:hypothetical protein